MDPKNQQKIDPPVDPLLFHALSFSREAVLNTLFYSQ